MDRRRFVAYLSHVPLVGMALAATQSKADDGSIQSFGYYQGLGPNEPRSPSRRDGTNYDMPCILADDIAAGEEKTYDFWHGHSRKHRFTIKPEHFEKLLEGQEVELFTDVVDGHRHALRLKPSEGCSAVFE